MQVKTKFKDNWIYIINILGLISMYGSFTFPIIGWCFIFGVTVVFWFSDKQHDDFHKFTIIGLVGTIMFWSNPYFIISFPSRIDGEIAFFVSVTVLLLSLGAYFVWAIKKASYTRDRLNVRRSDQELR